MGVAGGVHWYYGLIERVVEETSILDDASAEAAARSRLAASSPAPVFLDSQEATLSRDAGGWAQPHSPAPPWTLSGLRTPEGLPRHPAAPLDCPTVPPRTT